MKKNGQRTMFTLSGAALAVLLMQTESELSFALTAVLALILSGVLVWKTSLLEKLFCGKHWNRWPLSVLLCLCVLRTGKQSFFTNCYGWMDKVLGFLGLPSQLLIRVIPWLVALLAAPMVLGYMLWFVDFLWQLFGKLWRESDFTERFFLLGAGCIFGMMIVFTYLCTQAFYGAHVNGNWYNFDLIYSADSGYLVHQDVYRNVGAEQNDLRQPLFGLFAMPFSQAAWLLSKLLFFVPSSYATVSQIMQMFLFLTALVLLSRMLGIRGPEKALFLGFACVSYPVLIFALTAEQYLFAVSWLILLVYLRKEKVGGSLSFVAATGSLLTTGVLFPLVTWDRDFKKFVKKTMVLCGVFFAVMILCGRLTTFLDIPSYIAGYGYYSGVDVPPVQKLMQYVNFLGACLVAPPSGVDFTTYNHVSWQMLPVTGWSAAGLVVLAAAVAGIMLSWKEPLTKICAGWLAFSLLLLGLVGWGTIDNGLMLYSLYFGWAVWAMVFRLVERVLGRFRPLKIAAELGLILGIGFYNVYALRAVLVFSTQFYPALGG